jgi:DNA-directed RNA polymerase subunit delta
MVKKGSASHVNLEQYSPEELKELSMIELAYAILEGKKQATAFRDIVEEVSETLGLSKEQVTVRLAQFYTDLNVDGRFISLGENRWGLRSWYPYEQIEEEVLPQPKPKKKRKVDEDEFDDFAAEDTDYEDTDDLDDLDELEEDVDFIDDEDEDAEEFEDEDLIEDDEELDDLEEEEELEELEEDFEETEETEEEEEL